MRYHQIMSGTGPILLLLLWFCQAAVAVEETGAPSPLAEALRQQLQLMAPTGDSSLNRDALRRFYAAEHYRPVWIGADGPNRRASQLRERLRDSRSEGLVPQHYLIDRIEPLWSADSIPGRLRLELLLSSAFIDYARDVRSGRFEPQQVAPLWEIERVPADAVTMLRLALISDDFAGALDALPPIHPQYRRLRTALATYRELEAQGGWPEIPAGPSIRPGMHDPRVPLLRRRLQLEGDLALPGLSDSDHYDDSVVFAVEHFQVRHGLKVDGIVGRQTLAAMNVPVADRIEQIVLSMERWRWLPQHLGRRHLIVNIPAYELVAYEDGVAQMSMPVIIGTQERPTPAASGLLHTVVFNPYWTVPRKIALKDVIPKQRRNPNYMLSQHIRVFADWNGGKELDPRKVNWSAVNQDYLPYMLRQDPGPKNALGHVKFLFNNRFSVYLHDTPNEALFADSERAYSSGCIRVEEPLRLANFLLQHEREWRWSEEKIKEVIGTNRTYEVPLSAPIQVYLLYLTAWVGEGGSVNFLRDVYGEDALLAMCMPFEEQNP